MLLYNDSSIMKYCDNIILGTLILKNKEKQHFILFLHNIKKQNLRKEMNPGGQLEMQEIADVRLNKQSLIQAYLLIEHRLYASLCNLYIVWDS